MAQYTPSGDAEVAVRDLYVHPLGWSTSGREGGNLTPEQMLALGERLIGYAIERIRAEQCGDGID